MKKLLTASFLLVIATAINAQSIYLRAGTGYGFPIASATLGSNTERTSSTSTDTYSFETVSGSYGAGGNLNITFGYELNKNLILELNTQYFISKKYESSENYTYIGTGYSYVSQSDYTSSSKGLFFNPSVIFSAGFGKAAPYGRFGFVIGKPKVLASESSYDNGDGEYTTEVETEYSKGLAFGFQGAVGMNWELSEKLDLFTELNFISATYYAGESNITKYISNGTDYLPTIPLSQKQVIFKKKYDINNSTYYPNEPSVQLKESAPFSSLSMQVGVRFYLFTPKE